MDDIAYRDLRPGEVIQAGDEWQVESGQWSQISPALVGQTTGVRARRPYNITELLRQRDQAAHEYRLHREALTAAQAALKATMANGLQACRERDLARSEVARLSTELWARKPLEDRVASLTEELAQAREANQQLLQTIADNADQFAEHTASLVKQRDEARAELGVALTRVIALEHNLAETKKGAARIAQEYAEWSKEAEAARSQLQRERDEAEQALQMARASLEETRLAREFVIEERNEAERALSEERAAHVQASNDRDRLIVELNECQQQRQHLATALEELQRRRDTAEAGYQANTLTVGEVVENILSALEIASHALEYLADVGANEEAGHYCGFSAAIAVVKQIKESAK